MNKVISSEPYIQYQEFADKLKRKEISLKSLQRLVRPLFKTSIIGNAICLKSKLTKKTIKLTFDLPNDYCCVSSNGFLYHLFTPDTKTLFNKLIKYQLL